MALPLIALAATLAPELIRLIAGDRAGRVADAVSGAVQEVAGTADPAAARAALADPARADALRVRLAEIALDAARAADAAEAARQANQLDTLRAGIADVAAARGGMVELARIGSGLAWGPATISTLVVIGFFAVLVLLVTLDGNGGARFDPQVASVVNVTVGALGAAFAAVVNFWIGSSQGSREKDAIVGRLRDARDAAIAAPRAEAPVVSLAALRPSAPAAEDRFDRCLTVVLAEEGGFVNDPRDPGGATNMGITRATLSAFRDAEASVEDVRDLTRAEAREIYRSRYWTPLRCEALPPGVDLSVFDFGVNAGPGRAARLVQRAAGVTPDGSIGPITLAAIAARRPEDLIARFAEGRMEHYRSLSTFATFGRGWTNRTETVRREATAMATSPVPLARAA
ncbi:glycoside hydrolase family 108 protein [Roseomonas sp. CCTCC AB2023176]|uniref:glycoside hydrolase family 108 protein n=1 Tax=Roseomonas sp. CCTCC AB2023176 TaxID=3342640 RepID=UPI0035E1FC9A